MHQAVIVGAGFAGLGMAMGLKRAGIDDFVVLERAEEVGGTWRENHYPGAACDVESHLYSYSFEPNPRWTRSFAPQREILDYLIRCSDGTTLRARVLVSASGFLNRPSLPDIPGLGAFRGKTFHTARWDHSFS